MKSFQNSASIAFKFIEEMPFPWLEPVFCKSGLGFDSDRNSIQVPLKFRKYVKIRDPFPSNLYIYFPVCKSNDLGFTFRYM